MAKKWYVVHTYSGHENKAKLSLLDRVRQRPCDDCRDEGIGHGFARVGVGVGGRGDPLVLAVIGADHDLFANLGAAARTRILDAVDCFGLLEPVGNCAVGCIGIRRWISPDAGRRNQRQCRNSQSQAPHHNSRPLRAAGQSVMRA